MINKALKVQTNIHEIYMKLPSLNYNNEIIFSSDVPERAIRKIIDKFGKSGVEIELHRVGDRIALIKKGQLKFNTYLK